VIDADIVSPGLIDLQVNGAFGREVTANPHDIDFISQNLLSTGCTAWLPTVVTAPADFYPPVFAGWPEHKDEAGAVPLGFHLEGPFISREKKGAHRIECIDAASDELFDSWLEQDSIVLVTLAPEREGATDRIRRLVERGILVSLGHARRPISTTPCRRSTIVNLVPWWRHWSMSASPPASSRIVSIPTRRPCDWQSRARVSMASRLSPT
jgi:N-acetylglucosamine-6-phosphate deacetylase